MKNQSQNTTWHEIKKNDITFKIAGHIFNNGTLLSNLEAFELISNSVSNNTFGVIFIQRELKGQFGFIYEDKSIIIALVDKIRSFPIFYKNNKTNPNINLLKNDEDLIDVQALNEFEMAGYTLGKKTLFQNIHQILPGEYIKFDKLNKNEIKSNRYFRYFNPIILDHNRSELIEKIDSIVNSSIKNLIKIANGRTIVLPLSAGYDSRLILGKLIEFGYKKIICYTYGPKNIWEAKVAKKVCLQHSIQWEFVRLTQKDKKLFYTEDRFNYYQTASGFCSIPHLADFYSLKKLIQEGIIEPHKSVIVNGQTGDFITGGHIPKDILTLDKKNILQNFINKHFSLWENLKTPEQIAIIEQEILKNIEMEFDSLNPEILAKQFELIECEERQFKYVVNGQRAYDFYNIDWYLPFWSDEFIDFFSKLKLQDKLNQNAYIEYCKTYNPSLIFNETAKGNINSLPFSLKLANLLIRIFSKIFPIDKTAFRKKYFSYFDKYSPYYPMLSYREFLKSSKFHRHCVSYWVKFFLKENNIK